MPRDLQPVHTDAATLRWAVDLLRGLENLRVGDGLELTKGPTGITISATPTAAPARAGEDLAVVELTAAGPADGLYLAREVARNAAGTAWVAAAAGRVFGGSGPLDPPALRELADATGLADADQRVHLARFTPREDGTGEWVFRAAAAGTPIRPFEVAAQDGQKVTAVETDGNGNAIELATPDGWAWAYPVGATVYGFEVPPHVEEGSDPPAVLEAAGWRLVPLPPSSYGGTFAGSGPYRVAQVLSNGLVGFDYVRGTA